MTDWPGSAASPRTQGARQKSGHVGTEPGLDTFGQKWAPLRSWEERTIPYTVGAIQSTFSEGPWGNGAQALQQLRQEPEQPFQAGVSLGGCLQWPSALSFGDRVTLGGLLSTEAAEGEWQIAWGSWRWDRVSQERSLNQPGAQQHLPLSLFEENLKLSVLEAWDGWNKSIYWKLSFAAFLFPQLLCPYCHPSSYSLFGWGGRLFLTSVSPSSRTLKADNVCDYLPWFVLTASAFFTCPVSFSTSFLSSWTFPLIIPAYNSRYRLCHPL